MAAAYLPLRRDKIEDEDISCCFTLQLSVSDMAASGKLANQGFLSKSKAISAALSGGKVSPIYLLTK